MTSSSSVLDPLGPDPEARLAGLRPYLKVGAIFWVADELLLGRHWTEGKIRPVMLLQSVATHLPAPVVLLRNVAVSARMSYKQESFGPLIGGAAFEFDLRQKGLLYTPARVIPRLSKPGVFDFRHRDLVKVGFLDPVFFAGYLPRRYLDSLVARGDAEALSDPYPPAER
jgi:hypothetical protein